MIARLRPTRDYIGKDKTIPPDDCSRSDWNRAVDHGRIRDEGVKLSVFAARVDCGRQISQQRGVFKLDVISHRLIPKPRAESKCCDTFPLADATETIPSVSRFVSSALGTCL